MRDVMCNEFSVRVQSMDGKIFQPWTNFQKHLLIARVIVCLNLDLYIPELTIENQLFFLYQWSYAKNSVLLLFYCHLNLLYSII